MTNQSPPNHGFSRRLAAFYSQDEVTQRVGYALAWLLEPISVSSLTSRMASAQIRDEKGNRLTNAKVKSSLQALKNLEIVQQESGAGWTVGLTLSHYLVAGCMAEGIGEIQQLPLSDHPNVGRFGYGYGRYTHGRNPELLAVRDLRTAFYGGDDKELVEVREKIRSARRDVFPWQFLLYPFDAERVLALPTEFREEAVAFCLEVGIDGLHHSFGEILSVATETASSEDDLGSLCAAALFTGDRLTLDAACDILREAETPMAKVAHLEAEASEAFFQGDDDQAIALFEESITRWRKATRKKKACPRGLFGFWFLAALLRRGRIEDLPVVRKYAKWGIDLDSAHGAYLQLLSDFSGPLSGKSNQIMKGRLENYLEAWLENETPSLEDLFYFQSAFLVGADSFPRVRCAEALDRLKTLAAERGFPWVAAEAASLRNAWKGKPTGKEADEALALWEDVGAGAKAFTISLSAPEPWETTLLAIETLGHERAGKSAGKKSASEKSASQKQLVWVLDAEDYYWKLSAVERTLYASGKASKGRKVALKRLKERSTDMPHLTDQDRAVASRIKRYSSWGSDDYILDNNKALLDLAGHPLLFSDDKMSKPLDLVRVSPTLSLSETRSGKVKLTLSPKAEYASAEPELVLESPTRYLVVDVKETHVRLFEAFGLKCGAELPAGSRGRIAKALGNLAGDLMIEADDIEGVQVEAETVSGDPTPVLRLFPHGEGLHAELLVRPVAQVEITQAPGEGKALILANRDGKPIRVKRDLRAEKSAFEEVLAACPALAGLQDARDGAWSILIDEPLGCLELLTELHPISPEKLRVEWPESQPFRLHSVADTSRFEIALGGSKDWLTASGNLQLDEDLVLSMRQLLELTEAAKKTPGFIRLEDGQFLALTREFSRQLEDLRAFSQPTSGDKYRIHPLAALALDDLVENANAKTSTAWKKQIARLRDQPEQEIALPPSTLQAELRPYQLEGYQWLSRLSRWGMGACLADDMGLGKTVQALALLLERAPDGPALVIAPTSVVGNWLEETVRFAPTLNPIILGQQSGDRESQLQNAGPFDLIIASWGLLQTGAATFAETHWHTIVLDEAQAIKNRSTKRSQAAMKLQAEFRMITTGTPVENNLGELHNLFQFINPGLLGSWERFRKTFADPIERNDDAAARDRLRRLIRPFILRRLKSSVLRDLPPRTEIALQVELTAEESAFYEALRQKAVEDVERAREESEGPGQNAIRILAELMRLRRACCHPRLVDPETKLAGSKLSVFADTLEEILANKHKVLVFSQFVDHLSILREHLDKEKITYQYLDGSTPVKKRQTAVRDFQSGIGDVFLISLKAGGTGLNLTAADYVIHMDPWWNPAAEDQASDRAHRIGQTRPVTIYRLITKGAIEERIVDLHHRKRHLADSILEGTESAGRLSPDELLELLRG